MLSINQIKVKTMLNTSFYANKNLWLGTKQQQEIRLTIEKDGTAKVKYVSNMVLPFITTPIRTTVREFNALTPDELMNNGITVEQEYQYFRDFTAYEDIDSVISNKQTLIAHIQKHAREALALPKKTEAKPDTGFSETTTVSLPTLTELADQLRTLSGNERAELVNELAEKQEQLMRTLLKSDLSPHFRTQVMLIANSEPTSLDDILKREHILKHMENSAHQWQEYEKEAPAIISHQKFSQGMIVYGESPVQSPLNRALQELQMTYDHLKKSMQLPDLNVMDLSPQELINHTNTLVAKSLASTDKSSQHAWRNLVIAVEVVSALSAVVDASMTKQHMITMTIPTRLISKKTSEEIAEKVKLDLNNICEQLYIRMDNPGSATHLSFAMITDRADRWEMLSQNAVQIRQELSTLSVVLEAAHEQLDGMLAWIDQLESTGSPYLKLVRALLMIQPRDSIQTHLKGLLRPEKMHSLDDIVAFKDKINNLFRWFPNSRQDNHLFDFITIPRDLLPPLIFLKLCYTHLHSTIEDLKMVPEEDFPDEDKETFIKNMKYIEYDYVDSSNLLNAIHETRRKVIDIVESDGSINAKQLNIYINYLLTKIKELTEESR